MSNDVIITGDNTNIGGVQNIGKFTQVVSGLEKSGNAELAKALTGLGEAILKSKNLDDEQKRENIEAVTTLADEIAKPKPNTIVIKALSEGLITALKLIPDVVKAVETLSPLLVPLLIGK